MTTSTTSYMPAPYTLQIDAITAGFEPLWHWNMKNRTVLAHMVKLTVFTVGFISVAILSPTHWEEGLCCDAEQCVARYSDIHCLVSLCKMYGNEVCKVFLFCLFNNVWDWMWQVQYKMLALYVLHTEVCVNSLKIYYHSPLATPSLPHVGRAAGVQTVQILHVLGIRYQYTHAPINGKVSKPTWLY